VNYSSNTNLAGDRYDFYELDDGGAARGLGRLGSRHSGSRHLGSGRFPSGHLTQHCVVGQSGLLTHYARSVKVLLFQILFYPNVVGVSRQKC